MPLTDQTIPCANPKAKPYKLTDERGLHLLIHPNSGKYWRFSYRFDGKQKTLALGVYPDVSLAQARERRDEARALLKSGIDPSMARKTSKEEAVQRTRESTKEAAALLKFELADTGALLIEADGAKLLLNPAQASALRIFLDATNPESNKETPSHVDGCFNSEGQAERRAL
jgi:hypothetical protein